MADTRKKARTDDGTGNVLSQSDGAIIGHAHGDHGPQCTVSLPFKIAGSVHRSSSTLSVGEIQALVKDAGFFSILPAVAAWKSAGAETVYRAKYLLMVDEKNTVLSPGFVAVRNGNIVAVGDNEAVVIPWTTHETKHIDLGDATIVPGFHEPHMHFLSYGVFLTMVDCGVENCPTVESVYERLAEAAKKTDKKFVLGWNFDMALIESHHQLDCDELQKAVPDKNVLVVHSSMHIVFVNRKFLNLLGFTEDSKPPEGGKLGRDENGKLTGELAETPCLLKVMHELPPLTYKALMDAGMRTAAYLHKRGVTCATDAATGMLAQEGDFHIYQDIATHRSVPIRIFGMPLNTIIPKPMFHTGFGNAWHRVGCMKIILDGSAQGFTAWLKEPYHTQPENTGIPGMAPDAFRECALWSHTHGFQLAIHCNGDAALELALDTMEWILECHPRADHRHRIEHCQVPSVEQLHRLKKLNMVANFLVSHTYFWGDWHMEKTFGPERAPHMSPCKTAEKIGLRWTIHSDAPVTPPGPLHHMFYAMNRVTRSGKVVGPEERVDVRAALRAVTIDAAYASHCDAELGSIELGKLADFAILDQNPYEVESMKIRDIKVLGTVSNGVHFPVKEEE